MNDCSGVTTQAVWAGMMKFLVSTGWLEKLTVTETLFEKVVRCTSLSSVSHSKEIICAVAVRAATGVARW